MSGAAALEDKYVKTFKLHSNSILRLAYSYLKNMSEAEDVLQDTMLSLVKNSIAFISAEHEKAWLVRVVINLCKNRLKSSRHKSVSIPDDLHFYDIASGESEGLKAVHDLPEKYREVVHLHYIEGYSSTEISSILRKNESTVRSLLHRSRAMLKETLKGAYDFDE